MRDNSEHKGHDEEEDVAKRDKVEVQEQVWLLLLFLIPLGMWKKERELNKEQISTASPVTQTLYRTFVVKRKLSCNANLSYWSWGLGSDRNNEVVDPAIWNKLLLLGVRVQPRRSRRLKSLDIWREFRVELLLLGIKQNQLRLFCDLIWSYPGVDPEHGEEIIDQIWPGNAMWSPRGELENVARERGEEHLEYPTYPAATTNRPKISRRNWMEGWMVRKTSNRKCLQLQLENMLCTFSPSTFYLPCGVFFNRAVAVDGTYTPLTVCYMSVCPQINR